jgi:hypothetical protein
LEISSSNSYYEISSTDEYSEWVSWICYSSSTESDPS